MGDLLIIEIIQFDLPFVLDLRRRGRQRRWATSGGAACEEHHASKEETFFVVDQGASDVPAAATRSNREVSRAELAAAPFVR